MPARTSITERIPPENASPLWYRVLSLLLLSLALILFPFSLGARVFEPRAFGIWILVLLIGLSLIALLHASYWRHARRKQKTADSAFQVSDCEFASVFQHALDGILILDDRATCLDANPAACRIVGVSLKKLLGRSTSEFFADQAAFARNWSSFLREHYQRGRAQLVRGDHDDVYVEYTVARYLDGRNVAILCDATERRRAEISLRNSEQRFQQMASHIQEVFWMMDAESKAVLYVNNAYESITGLPVSTLYDGPASYPDLIVPEDRRCVRAKFEQSVTNGQFDEEFRIRRRDGALRWIWVKAFPVPDELQVTRWLVGTAQDVTARKLAELEVAKQLGLVESARAEAEALRRSTLAITQNLSINSVLDTLLACLADLVPYDSATVLLAESGLHLFAARQAPRSLQASVLTFDARMNVLFQRVLVELKNVLVANLADEPDSNKCEAFRGMGCWMGVPLLGSGQTLGLLSIGSSQPHRFTPEHLRLAKSLAIPAAVAIQNARLYERAAIYGEELGQRLKELKQMQDALDQSRSGRSGPN
ncbi:MAG: PAS domain S-box protein [Candidatus Acidiferrales bacterium]